MDASATDRRDQLVVTVAALIWLAGTYVGSGLAGEGVSRQAQGLFSDHATLIAPHGPAFSIWGVIYLGLAWYVIWQWLPRFAGSDWARATRIPAAASLALNGIWLFVVQAGLVWLSVIVMVGIVVSLGILLGRTRSLASAGLATTLAVPGAFGLYLGWICVATCANIASFLVDLGVPATGTGPMIATVAVLLVVVGLVAYLLPRLDRRCAPWLVAAVAWGVSWVAVGRLTGQLRSDIVGWTAVAVALAVVGVLLRERSRAPLTS